MAKLYGVGVGPGDSELMTLKGLRLIKENNIIAVPRSGQNVNAALTIAEGAYPNIHSKEILELDMPMVRDKKVWKASHIEAAQIIETKLDEGENVVFLTLGDPSVYSTYSYVHELVKADGYETEMVAGVPSFCAVSAKLNVGLTEESKALHIIPASYDGLEEAMEMPGTKVLMKSGKAIGRIKEYMREHHSDSDIKMVERCGMSGEKIYSSLEDIDVDAGYFSIVVVKEK